MQYWKRQINIPTVGILFWDFNSIATLIIKLIESWIIRHFYNTTQQLSLLKIASNKINASKINRRNKRFINRNDYISVGEWTEMAENIFKVELKT